MIRVFDSLNDRLAMIGFKKSHRQRLGNISLNYTYKCY